MELLGGGDGGDGLGHRPPTCYATFDVAEKDICPRALEKTPVNFFELPAR